MSPEELNIEIHRKLCDLTALVESARRECESLEAAIDEARRLRVPVTADALALIESLADPESLADASRLAAVAAHLAPAPADDLFARDRDALAIATLAEQGHSSAEISRQLGLPLGEVEFRRSVRS